MMKRRKGEISGMLLVSVYAMDFFKLSKMRRPAVIRNTWDEKRAPETTYVRFEYKSMLAFEIGSLLFFWNFVFFLCYRLLRVNFQDLLAGSFVSILYLLY